MLQFLEFLRSCLPVIIPALLVWAGDWLWNVAYDKGHKAGRKSLDQDAFISAYKAQMRQIYGEGAGK